MEGNTESQELIHVFCEIFFLVMFCKFLLETKREGGREGGNYRLGIFSEKYIVYLLRKVYFIYA